MTKRGSTLRSCHHGLGEPLTLRSPLGKVSTKAVAAALQLAVSAVLP